MSMQTMCKGDCRDSRYSSVHMLQKVLFCCFLFSCLFIASCFAFLQICTKTKSHRKFHFLCWSVFAQQLCVFFF